MTANPHPAPAEFATVSTLSGEHAELLEQTRTRASAVRASVHAGTDPTQPLAELVRYLQRELLQQLVDEEWLLFRSGRHDPAGLARLRRDHLELRLTVEDLAAAAGRKQWGQQLEQAVADFLTQLHRHLAVEETVLGGDSDEPPPGTAALGARPHQWYDLTEGPVVDLDRLPGPAGADAALDRLLRLRPGERVDLVSSTDPAPLYRRLTRTGRGPYGIAYRTEGPPAWRVEVTCRTP